MIRRCSVCQHDIHDSYYWLVNDDAGAVDIWCALCHADYRDGVRDVPVWEDEGFEGNDKDEDKDDD